MRYHNLRLFALDEDHHKRTCGYWYTVTDRELPHTAFRTRAALDAWLSITGLGLSGPGISPVTWGLPPLGIRGTWTLDGTYSQIMHASAESLAAAAPELPRILWLSNGDYTVARFEVDVFEGEHVIHCLGPNVRDRPTYPHALARRAWDQGLPYVSCLPEAV